MIEISPDDSDKEDSDNEGSDDESNFDAAVEERNFSWQN